MLCGISTSEQPGELSPCPVAQAQGRRSRCPFLRVLGESCGCRGSLLGCAEVTALLARCRSVLARGRGAGSRPGLSCRWQCLRGAGARCGTAGTKGAPVQGTPWSLTCPGLRTEPQAPREAGSVPASAPGAGCAWPHPRVQPGCCGAHGWRHSPLGVCLSPPTQHLFHFCSCFPGSPLLPEGLEPPLTAGLSPSSSSWVLPRVGHTWSRGEVGAESSASSWQLWST